MNKKFFDLPEEKRQDIINGALHVFSKYDYKKASTDEIAAQAGVSKSLLFHYFGSKKGLYMFIYSYANEFLIREMSQCHNYEEKDFFKILLDAQACKLRVLLPHPDIILFIFKAYFEEEPSIKPLIDKSFESILTQSSRAFLQRADTGKFKEGVSPEEVLNIILWMSEGFMRNRMAEQALGLQNLPPKDRSAKQLGDLKKYNDEYQKYIDLLRRQFYKPEFI